MANLLDPLKIKGLELKNRIVMPPMAMDKGTSEGEVTDWIINHYLKRVTGIGLVIVEHSYVHPLGKHSPRQMGIYDDKLIPGLTRLAKAIKGRGPAVAIQITHSGARISSAIEMQPIAPSASPFFAKESPRTLKIEEIESLIWSFGEAAARAKKAGFDAVEVHGAHGFLLNEFHSPLTNKRSDKYGGGLENRIRFTLAVVSKVKEKIGDDYPFLFRLGADDRLPGGLTIEEAKIIAKKLVEAGVHILDVSGGLCGSRPQELKDTPGYFVYLAKEIKKVVDVPVIGVGGIKTREIADEIVRSGMVDLVAIGSAILKDPEWALKAVKGLKG